MSHACTWADGGLLTHAHAQGKGCLPHLCKQSTPLATVMPCRIVIKIMKPVKEHRLRREIKILRHLAGGPHIIPLFEVDRDLDTKTPCFVFELVNATSFRELQASVTDYDVRHYMYQLLQVGVHRAHNSQARLLGAVFGVCRQAEASEGELGKERLLSQVFIAGPSGCVCGDVMHRPCVTQPVLVSAARPCRRSTTATVTASCTGMSSRAMC